ncbi:hypothetical protein [Paracoccus mutanolyticus]|uniref:hypothetical protein n=1 Tax=Paracoccus mutanolyticus TaxID=1499308 RepID=UPI00167948B3|nr:hypothetical protein [Paracoccus mutanolyticus]
MTEAGRSYVANIRRAFELIAEATEMLKSESRHLTISVTPTFASRWLIPRLPDLTANTPGYRPNDLERIGFPASSGCGRHRSTAMGGHPSGRAQTLPARLIEQVTRMPPLLRKAPGPP